MSEIEKYITDSGLVEFAEWHFKKDECGEYLHEPTNIAHKIWGEKDRVIGHKQNEIDLLKRLIEIKDQGSKEQQDQIAELKAQKERLQKQFNFLLDKNIRDESTHASLKLRVMRVSHLMDKAAENGTECVDIGSLYDALIKDGDLDQSLRGASDQHLNR